MARKQIQPQIPPQFTPPPDRYSDEVRQQAHEFRRAELDQKEHAGRFRFTALDGPSGLLHCIQVTVIMIVAFVGGITWIPRAIQSRNWMEWYGCAMMLMFPLPAVVGIWFARKRHIQSRRVLEGRCIFCDYDLRGSADICPECGQTAVKQQ